MPATRQTLATAPGKTLAGVSFTDPELRACVASRYDDSTDLRDVLVLACGSRNIENLPGLEQLTSLQRLALFDSRITGIGPLGRLTDLVELEIFGNDIVDIQALAGLTRLRVLYAWDNRISEISPLVGLRAFGIPAPAGRNPVLLVLVILVAVLRLPA